MKNYRHYSSRQLRKLLRGKSNEIEKQKMLIVLAERNKMPKRDIEFMTNKIFNESNVVTMAKLPDNCIDLTITSPPYEDLRHYEGYTFDFEKVANELYRITKKGGVVVWVVSDATIKGTETGASFKDALYFKKIGFNLHDTMIWLKNPMPQNHNRYEQAFEYMFVLSKGKPKTFNPIRVPKLYKDTRKKRNFHRNKKDNSKKKVGFVGKQNDKVDINVWKINVGGGHVTKDKIAYQHPAIFPEKLAYRHIISWSNENDIVYDSFMGSGTVAKVCLLTNRKYIGSELSKKYCDIAETRLRQTIENDMFLKLKQ